MPIRHIDEIEIRKIAQRYIRSVQRNPESIPNIQEIISEAIRNAAPNREFDPLDIISVISNLKTKNIINDKVIHEAVKSVIDHSAMKDLKFMIGRNAKAVGRKLTTKEVDEIIKQSKLNPYTASLPQIKKAVNDYFNMGRPLEFVEPTELQNTIRGEMKGPVDERDVKAIMAKYIENADQDKPVNKTEIQSIIQSHMASRSKTAPKPGQTQQQKEGKSTNNQVKQGGFVPPKDPKHLTFFEKTRIKLQRYGIKSLTRGARNWLTDEVSVLKKVDRKKFLKEEQTVADALIGNMFMYFYDAKTKDRLPYWDKFPLIFVIELYEDGWLGLNLHYLNYPLRMKLFDKLLQFANDKSLDKITQLRLSYALLKNVAQFPEVRPCIKRYLSEYVKSNLLKIKPIDWEIALFLPVEQFQKEKRETVWERSRQKILQLKRKR